MTGITASVFALASDNPPSCEEHGHALDLMRNGGNCGYLFVCADCECVVEAFEYANSTEFLSRMVRQLRNENEELKERIEEFES